MSNCINCGAALPANSLVCPYCKTRNDVDLKGLYQHHAEEPGSERVCPRCDIRLQTIDIELQSKFLIERCPDCLGLFFDPNELETILDRSVSKAYQVDFKQLENINKLRRTQDYPVTYIKCPVCRKLMNRHNFGTQSGVIIDKCKEHGVWLDGGELRQLMDWLKAGGQILNQQTQLEMERKKRLEAERKLRENASRGMGTFSTDPRANYDDPGLFSESPDILNLIARMVGKFFRF